MLGRVDVRLTKNGSFFGFCICYYFCICICVYIWFVFIVLCIVCICGTQLLVCSSDQYLASDAPGVATHYWLDRHICVDSDDDEVLVWKLEALAGMILVKLGLGLSQSYLKNLRIYPWSEWASDIEALPEHLTDWQPTTPCHYHHRVGICPCGQCRRQCKIFASGVNFSIFTHLLCFFLLKLLKLGEIDGVKFLARKSGGVNFWTNSMSG